MSAATVVNSTKSLLPDYTADDQAGKAFDIHNSQRISHIVPDKGSDHRKIFVIFT